MNIDIGKLVRTVKNVPSEDKLAVIALAIVGAIIKHQNVVIVLPLVGILALIVMSLIRGSLRRH